MSGGDVELVTALLEVEVSTHPGAEPTLARECRRWGLRIQDADSGVIRGQADAACVARLNLQLRTAHRVLVRVGRFDAPGRRELVQRARRVVDRTRWALPSSVDTFQIQTQRSRLYHTGLIEEALREAWSLPPSGPPSDTSETSGSVPSSRWVVRMHDDVCSLWIDTSGEPLHRRGYRQEGSHAALRETLAAAVLGLSGYTGQAPFVDPMCGSGTLAIEAAWIAHGIPPSHARPLAADHLPALAQEMRLIRAESLVPGSSPPRPVWASDIHAGALGAARRNADRAGVSDQVTFERRDVAVWPSPPAETGWLVTNPPYGHRVGNRSDSRGVDAALAALRQALSGPFRSWTRGILLPPGWAARTFGTPDWTVALDNGGRPVELSVYGPGRVP